MKVIYFDNGKLCITESDDDHKLEFVAEIPLELFATINDNNISLININENYRPYLYVDKDDELIFIIFGNKIALEFYGDDIPERFNSDVMMRCKIDIERNIFKCIMDIDEFSYMTDIPLRFIYEIFNSDTFPFDIKEHFRKRQD